MGSIITKIININKKQQYVEFNNDNICPICLEDMDIHNIIVLDCYHKFHANCIFNSMANNNSTCPMCREKIKYKYPRRRRSYVYTFN